MYEYVVLKEWIASLEKGCRLYYDITEQAYVYHTEHENKWGSDLYTTYDFSSKDLILTVDSVNHLIEDGHATAGPELGELEFNNDTLLEVKSSKGKVVFSVNDNDEKLQEKTS